MPYDNFVALEEDLVAWVVWAGSIPAALTCRGGTCTHRLPHKLGRIVGRCRAVSRIGIWTAALLRARPRTPR